MFLKETSGHASHCLHVSLIVLGKNTTLQKSSLTYSQPYKLLYLVINTTVQVPEGMKQWTINWYLYPMVENEISLSLY